MANKQADAGFGVVPRGEPMRALDFSAECRRQSLLLKDDPHEAEILKWIESVSDTVGWDG